MGHLLHFFESIDILLLLFSVRERQINRMGTLPSKKGQEKPSIAYVPRGQANFKPTGLSSGGEHVGTMPRPGDQNLDEESKIKLAELNLEDEKKDQRIDSIGNTVDNLTHIAERTHADR